MGLDERLRKLEGHQPPEQCPKCHDQLFAVYVLGEPRPEPCPRCHKMANFVVEANSEECAQMVRRLLSGELPKPAFRKEETDEDQS